MSDFLAAYDRTGMFFQSLDAAVNWSREFVQKPTSPAVVSIWRCSEDGGRGVVIGVVTHDANGITIHCLAGWPEGEQGRLSCQSSAVLEG